MSKFEEFKASINPEEVVFSITLEDVLYVLEEMPEADQDKIIEVISPAFIRNKIGIDWYQEVKNFLEVQVDIISAFEE